MRTWPVVLVFALCATTASARGRGESDEEMAKRGFAIEMLGVRVGGIAPWLGDLVFEGDGHIAGQPAHYRSDARSLGLLRPQLTDLAVDAVGIRFLHLLFVGLELDAQWGGIQATNGLGDSMIGFGGAMNTGIVWTKGFFDVRGDLAVGVREYSIPIFAFDIETCHARGGAPFPCYASASAIQWYAQPRVRGAVHLGSWLTLGGYAGLDLTTGVGWLGGVYAALNTPSWAPDMEHLDDMHDDFRD